uniref:Uncharacterized protein n=1 Tax=Arundo donax TaxID=35708 RepID=A0A0A9AP00_ARUDO
MSFMKDSAPSCCSFFGACVICKFQFLHQKPEVGTTCTGARSSKLIRDLKGDVNKAGSFVSILRILDFHAT